MLEIADSGVNIHLAKQSTPTMAPIIMENYMKASLPYGSTMESKHIATLQLPGLRNQARKIYIYPKMQIAQLISLWFLWNDGCIITLDKQEMSVKNNGK